MLQMLRMTKGFAMERHGSRACLSWKTGLQFTTNKVYRYHGRCSALGVSTASPVLLLIVALRCPIWPLIRHKRPEDKHYTAMTISCTLLAHLRARHSRCLGAVLHTMVRGTRERTGIIRPNDRGVPCRGAEEGAQHASRKFSREKRTERSRTNTGTFIRCIIIGIIN